MSLIQSVIRNQYFTNLISIIWGGEDHSNYMYVLNYYYLCNNLSFQTLLKITRRVGQEGQRIINVCKKNSKQD
jgi:hypothetical protein